MFHFNTYMPINGPSNGCASRGDGDERELALSLLLLEPPEIRARTMAEPVWYDINNTKLRVVDVRRAM
jgi:hypothetical protein